MKKKKIIIVVVVLAVVVAAYFLLSKKSATSSGSGSYSPDILAVLNRITPQQASNFSSKLSMMTPSQMQIMDSIAHSWNNNIPLTSDQSNFWATVAAF